MHCSEILSIERALCLKQIQERIILSWQIIQRQIVLPCYELLFSSLVDT